MQARAAHCRAVTLPVPSRRVRPLAHADVLPDFNCAVRGAGPDLEAAAGRVPGGKDVAADALVAVGGIAALEPAEQLARDAHVVHEDAPRLALRHQQVPPAGAPDRLRHAVAADADTRIAAALGRLADGGLDSPRGHAVARLRKVVHADPARPGPGRDQAEAGFG